MSNMSTSATSLYDSYRLRQCSVYRWAAGSQRSRGRSSRRRLTCSANCELRAWIACKNSSRLLGSTPEGSRSRFAMACAAIKQVPSQRSRKSSRARRPATPLALQGRSARAPRPDRSADKVTLYTSRYCPYSQRVAFLAEVANDARIETMEVDHRCAPPISFLGRANLGELSGGVGRGSRNKPEWFNLLAQSAGMPPQVPLCRASFEGYQARVFNQSLIINQARPPPPPFMHAIPS